MIINSAELGDYKLDKEENLWAYCDLDCGVTHELSGLFLSMMEPEARRTYELSKSLQAPVYAMMRRGMLVDQDVIRTTLEGEPNAGYTLADVGPSKVYETSAIAKREVRNRQLGLVQRAIRLGGMEKDDTRKTNKWQVVERESLLQSLALAISGKTVNYHSPKQLQELLYKHMRLPTQTQRVKGKVKVATNAVALESLAQNYPRAKLICNAILECRTLENLAEVLRKRMDTDGRMRCSFNICGTETGRFSSSTSVWDTGMNLQNVAPELRRIFIPDTGKVLWNVDLEQAESRAVAYLSGDENYITACESADLHTTVASMIFGIPADKEYADGHKYYRHFTYRDMAKRAGHALNYVLTPHSLARNMKISVKQAFRVYLLYLGGEMRADKAAGLDLYDLAHEKDGRYLVFPGAFPGIKKWHAQTAVELETDSALTTPLGRKRYFWGKLDDMGTLREGVAYKPQSMIAEILNMGMLRIYHELPEAEIMSQVHDSVAGQCREEDLAYVVKRVPELLHMETPINGRTLIIPSEMKVGFNGRDLRKYVD